MNPSDHQTHLTRLQCNALRGIAMLGIVLHNWTHWLPVAVKENEFTFTPRNARRFFYILHHPDNFLDIHLLSFFGHYGVPIFIFLSGYGLVRKYENLPPFMPPHTFIASHWVKLFRMMIIGFALFLVVDQLTPQTHRYTGWHIFAQLGMFNNLLSEPQHIIWPGVYWFFGMMLQLYIVYRLLLFRRSDGWLWGLIAASWLLQALLPIAERDTLNCLRYNCVGALLPFCLGIWAGRHGIPWSKRAVSIAAFVAAVAFIVYGSGSYQSWLWVPVAVIIAAVSVVLAVPSRLLQPLTWVGSVSAALFLVHPTIRKVFLPQLHADNIRATLLIYLIVSVVAAWLIMPLLKAKK